MRQMLDFEETSNIIEFLNFLHRHNVKHMVNQELYNTVLGELRKRQPKMALLYIYRDSFASDETNE